MRKLGELNVVGTRTRVLYLLDTESEGELDADDFGAHQPQNATIYLRKWKGMRLEPSSLWGTTVHEAFHAFFWETGAYALFERMCNKWTRPARGELEERVIVAIAPVIAVMLAAGDLQANDAVCAVYAALRLTDGAVALRDACPDLNDAAHERFVSQLAERLGAGLRTAIPDLTRLHATIKKLGGAS